MVKLASFSLVVVFCTSIGAQTKKWMEPPFLREEVNSQALPPIQQRLPESPSVVELENIGRYGGTLKMLMASPRDMRILYVYSYARLVGLTPTLDIVPDILEHFTVEHGRIFTLFLRRGHRWSDGHAFTSEDFRYWWENMVHDPELRPVGPPSQLLVDGALPTVTILDDYTIQYAWAKPNPHFLLYLAGARPEPIYAPAHYLKQFHPQYASSKNLQERITQARYRNWVQLHNRRDNLNRYDNPDLPVLQPWIVTNRVPTTRFVLKRNPYYHRVDQQGQQLPYIDRIIVHLADSKIIAAQTGTGVSDLQARYLRFDDYTFLKHHEKQHNYQVRLWSSGSGGRIVLFPNLNVHDDVWRGLFRDVRFRRALSLAINREEINHVMYYGLAVPSNNTVLPQSPLFQEAYRTLWTEYNIKHANQLLDQISTRRDFWGTRLLKNGQKMDLIIESAGENTEETDVLQLIKDSWNHIGIRLFTKPLQREFLRYRIYSGQTLMTIGRGVDNGIPTPLMSPKEFVPTAQVQYQWPKWGQYYQTRGKAGVSPDMPLAQNLMHFLTQWQNTLDVQNKAQIWHQILNQHAQQQWTIGILSGVKQPVVVRNTLRNVPKSGLYNYDPGAHFGIYRPDTFWFTH